MISANMAPLVYADIYIIVMIITKTANKVKLNLQSNYFKLFITGKVAIVIKIPSNIGNVNRTCFSRK